MDSIFDVLRHLVQHGPGRNQPEVDALLGAVDQAEQKLAPKPAKKETDA